MPQPVAELVEPDAVVERQDPVVGIEIADIGHPLVEPHLVVGAQLEDRGLERAEMAREIEVALVAEGLVGEDQHGISGEGRLDGGDVGRLDRPAKIDVADLRGKILGDGMNGDCHGFLPLDDMIPP